MNARLERKLRVIVIIAAAGSFAGAVFAATHGLPLLPGVVTGLLISSILGGFEILIFDGPVRAWLNDRSFTASLLIKSTFYATVILTVQWFPIVEWILGRRPMLGIDTFWSSLLYSVVVSIIVNLALAITNLVGGRALLNFFTGRYHAPVEEERFVLFVDIAGSTGLAEKFGSLGIHRFLDRTFRELSLPVVDHRGEVLAYVGDEMIVTWTKREGAKDSRPLRCFMAMRDELAQKSGYFEREFGVAPRIRGSLHFGPVIIGEIGDVKRAIVFNGDVMNTTSRLEALSRDIDGGFVASRAAIAQFKSPLPVAMRDLGRLPIRGRMDGIDAMGLEETAQRITAA
ncbi:adenylate/guanylate cyclase domain-containing protein [Tardiphaga alba]|uniref:Adenylate/guanylate cyclase domain-containing protein n=1 Tax=Tardiphaga alba TaxID=340268 RepID=A0ABX8AAZ1_9BRAD|nr:adenylate/guanylate cyclase domain-containing protein [Tardiphaga alba]QUS39829.1 adenylate/guanylate cyclase domain-containing protein [Tardiphaga alba]